MAALNDFLRGGRGGGSDFFGGLSIAFKLESFWLLLLDLEFGDLIFSSYIFGNNTSFLSYF